MTRLPRIGAYASEESSFWRVANNGTCQTVSLSRQSLEKSEWPRATTAEQEAFEVTDRLLSEKEVLARTGLGRTTLWRMQNEGAFPMRVRKGKRGVAWRESVVSAWIENLEPAQQTWAEQEGMQ